MFGVVGVVSVTVAACSGVASSFGGGEQSPAVAGAGGSAVANPAGGSTAQGGATNSTPAGGTGGSASNEGGSGGVAAEVCLAGKEIQLSPWNADYNGWICSIDPYWNEQHEPECPDTAAAGADCGPWGGGFGFWLRQDGTYELTTNDMIIEHSTGDTFQFGTSLTELPEATDIEVVVDDYRTLRFRFQAKTATVIGLTWEPPED